MMTFTEAATVFRHHSRHRRRCRARSYAEPPLQTLSVSLQNNSMSAVPLLIVHYAVESARHRRSRTNWRWHIRMFRTAPTSQSRKRQHQQSQTTSTTTTMTMTTATVIWSPAISVQQTLGTRRQHQSTQICGMCRRTQCKHEVLKRTVSLRRPSLQGHCWRGQWCVAGHRDICAPFVVSRSRALVRYRFTCGRTPVTVRSAATSVAKRSRPRATSRCTLAPTAGLPGASRHAAAAACLSASACPICRRRRRDLRRRRRWLQPSNSVRCGQLTSTDTACWRRRLLQPQAIRCTIRYVSAPARVLISSNNNLCGAN